jgi:hypothetical protein
MDLVIEVTGDWRWVVWIVKLYVVEHLDKQIRKMKFNVRQKIRRKSFRSLRISSSFGIFVELEFFILSF